MTFFRVWPGGEKQPGRVFVHEPVLSGDGALHVLDFERSDHVIRTASPLGIGVCSCRHKKSYPGRACDAPMDICMTFHCAAASLVRHGIARQVSASECLGLLEKAHGRRLVLTAIERGRRRNFIFENQGLLSHRAMAAIPGVIFRLPPLHRPWRNDS